MRGPSVDAVVYTSRDISIPEYAKRLLLWVRDAGFKPTHLDQYEPMRSPFREEDFLRLWGEPMACSQIKELGGVLMGGSEPRFEAHFNWNRGPGAYFNSVGFAVKEEYFRREGATGDFLRILVELFETLEGAYGNAQHSAESGRRPFFVMRYDSEGRPKGKSTIGVYPSMGQLNLYWANLFGPEWAALFGKDKLANLPSGRAQELARGAYMVLTAESPLACRDERAWRMQDRIKEHLDSGAFLDWNGPERPLNHPDFDFSELRRWTSPQQAKAAEISIPGKPSKAQRTWLKDYPELAKRFVDRMAHGGVVLDYRPQSLTVLDRYLAGKQMSEDLIAEAGAYFAEVVMHALQPNHPGLLSVHPEYEEIELFIPRIGDGVFPIERVRKLCIEGMEYSLSFLWGTIKQRLNTAE